MIAAPNAARATRPGLAAYVTGQLDVPGYTVALVGYDGEYVATRAQAFRLPAPTRYVTVQLIDPDGKYAGPVVFGGTSSRVITGVRQGTNLGTIDVIVSKGYARSARKLAAKELDPTRWAYAHDGVPIGNGQNLGLVNFNGSKNGGSGPGEDEAHLGIPNEFDIAVPGKHLIKELAPPQKSARVSAAFSGLATASDAESEPATGPWMSSLGGVMGQTVNADAAAISVADIDAEMQGTGLFISTNLAANSNASLVELDCNGLSYCSQDGTGDAWLNALSGAQPGQYAAFPAVSLDPTTGFGELVGPAVPNDGLLSPLSGGGDAFLLTPRATSDQIGSGDVITTVATIGGVTIETPQTLPFVFETTPAITSYSDTAGNSGSITYPDTSGRGSPDTPSNAIKVAAGPNGDVVVTLTFFRPQRPGVAGAGEAKFMDIGHLGYALSALFGGSTQTWPQPPCDQSDYSDLSPTLSLTTANLPSAGPDACVLADSVSDQPAAPGSTNTLSFTVDLTKWLAERGKSFPVSTPSNPQPLTFVLSANVLASGDTSSDAKQAFTLERTS